MVLYARKCLVPLTFQCKVDAWIAAWLVAQGGDLPKQPEVRVVAWKQPSRGSVKVNVDASLDRMRRLADTAMVARDDHGTELAVMSHGLSYTGSNATLLEARPILVGLDMTHSRGWTQIVLESDFQVVVNAINNISSPCLYSFVL